MDMSFLCGLCNGDYSHYVIILLLTDYKDNMKFHTNHIFHVGKVAFKREI